MNSFFEYRLETNRVLDGISLQVLQDTISLFSEAARENRSVWILGNGGSASTASHLVTDFSKGVAATGAHPLKTFALSDMTALTTAMSNDVSFEESFSRILELYTTPKDIVLVLSVSGLSPNLVNAVQFANERGLVAVSWVGQRGVGMANLSNLSFVLPSNDYQIVENIHLFLGHFIMKEMGLQVDHG